MALSRRLGQTRCIAAAKSVEEAADLVLTMVGDYEKVVGRYDGHGQIMGPREGD